MFKTLSPANLKSPRDAFSARFGNLRSPKPFRFDLGSRGNRTARKSRPGQRRYGLMSLEKIIAIAELLAWLSYGFFLIRKIW